MVQLFKKEDFEPHLNSSFEVWPEGMDMVKIELVEVKDKSTTALTAFSLLFTGSPESVFSQMTHTVRHPAMGEMSIFIGPVHTGKADAICYQAIFSAPRGGDHNGLSKQQ
jgi:hypothetical protein